MTAGEAYTLTVLALAALLSFLGSRQAARGEVADGALGGFSAVGLIVLAFVVDSPV